VASGVKVTREQMAVAITQVQQAHDDVQSQRAKLASSAAELGGSWIGGASSAFQTAFEGFDAEVQKLLAALQGIHTGLNANHSVYNNVEAANTSVVNRVGAVING
jgi:WXG100 family type VII secretion target